MIPKEHPNVKVKDIVEIYDPEAEGCRLLLQVTSASLNEELKLKSESISVDYNVAGMFNLKAYSDVIMRVVNPSTVALDSVELTFKDQYMGRSEMWRLKTFLVSRTVIGGRVT